MKKVGVVLLVLLLSLPVQGSISTWIWGDDEAVGARIGTQITENNEAGLSMLVWPGDSDRDAELIALGLYGVYRFPQTAEFRNPLILDFLPETIEGRPYIGGKFDINLDTNKSSVAPVAGIVFQDILFLEYQFQSFSPDSASVSSKVVFGLRIKF